jgi:beta-barrel assembly-enhancing protease
LLAVLGSLLLACALVPLGSMDQRADLSSVMEIWGDVLRDADQVPMRLARVSAADEMAFGHRLQAALYYPAASDPAAEARVRSIGGKLTPYVRRTGMQYRFHAVESPQINAFAIPGGHVFVFTGMLGFVQSDDELASILGHEITHIDLRHCIERYQYELALRKIGLQDLGRAAEIARLPLTIGYRKYQEQEADEQGLRLCAQAGYDPTAGAALFRRMMAGRGVGPSRKPDTPAAEVAGMLQKSLAGYFRTHPAEEDRALHLEELARRYRKTP